MLHLLESSPAMRSGRARGAKAGGLPLSLALHGALIAAVVVVTARPHVVHGPPKPKDEHIVYVAPPKPLPATPAPAMPKAPTPKAAAPAPRPVTPRLPTPPAPTPTPEPPRVVANVPTADIPLNIPDVSAVSPNIAAKITDASDFSKKTTSSSSGGEVAPSSDAGEPGKVWSENTVDEPVQPLGSNPKPEYPEALRAQGVQADFTVQFVVDSTGRVETNTIEVPSETHSAFARIVRNVLSRSRYRPARAAGHKVAQLVQQRFAFQLDR